MKEICVVMALMNVIIFPVKMERLALILLGLSHVSVPLGMKETCATEILMNVQILPVKMEAVVWIPWDHLLAAVLQGTKETCAKLTLMSVKRATPVIMGSPVTTLKAPSCVCAPLATMEICVKMMLMTVPVNHVLRVDHARTLVQGHTTVPVWKVGLVRTVNCALSLSVASVQRARIQNSYIECLKNYQLDRDGQCGKLADQSIHSEHDLLFSVALYIPQ